MGIERSRGDQSRDGGPSLLLTRPTLRSQKLDKVALHSFFAETALTHDKQEHVPLDL